METKTLQQRFDELLDLASNMNEALYEHKSENADYYNGRITQISNPDTPANCKHDCGGCDMIDKCPVHN